jgi:hypothetical protein
VKVVACRQSTAPVSTGMSDDRNASEADASAIGIAKRVTHRMPHRLMKVNNETSAIATASTGMPGRYHCWIAAAESSAVSPQVGTQPHQ